MKITSNRLRKYLAIFVIISLVTLAIIVGFTVNEETWLRLRQFRLGYLLIIGISIVLRWLFDGMSLRALVNGNPALKMGIWKATKMRLECTFVSIIMPIMLSSTAFQAYLLYKEKSSFGESVAITSIRAILPIFLFVTLVPLSLMLGFQDGADLFFLKFIRLVSIPLILSLFFFTLAFVFPEWIKRMFSLAAEMIQRIGLLQSRNIEKAKYRFDNEIDRLHCALNAYRQQGKWSLVSALFWIVFSFFMEFSVAILILSGFGIHPQLCKAFGIQFFLKAILYFAPTPGGTGISEFSYLGFFTLYAPKYLVGIAVLMWRSFTYYLSVIAGGILVLKEHGINQITKTDLMEPLPTQYKLNKN